MKKLLIFMLVLCMASMANAVLVISVDGDPNPIDSEIWLAPSDSLYLDIHSINGDTGVGEGQTFYFALISDMLLGVINGNSGVTNIGPAPDASMLLGWAVADNFMGGITPGWDGPAGTVGAFVAVPPYADGVYFDLFEFHCEAPGDVLVQLIEIDMMTWAATGVVFDSVIIHQIPEPMTVLLLGLGGLFLRRRR